MYLNSINHSRALKSCASTEYIGTFNFVFSLQRFFSYCTAHVEYCIVNGMLPAFVMTLLKTKTSLFSNKQLIG